MSLVSINIDYLKRTYFYFDEAVNYQLDNKHFLRIYPVSVKDSEYFLSSCDILKIDKNSIPDAKIIQMSYLQFLYEKELKNEVGKQKLFNILFLCLKLQSPFVILNEMGKPLIMDRDSGIIINAKQFDDIKKIILYQNIIDYDDEYVNPDFQKNINESKMLKNKNIEIPNLERKMAIITAHTGISKKEQIEMTYRSHSLLFQEVYEESEYTTLYPLAAFNGKTDKVDKWIYKQKKNKFEDQVISVSDFNKQAGGNGEVAQRIVNN